MLILMMVLACTGGGDGKKHEKKAEAKAEKTTEQKPAEPVKPKHNFGASAAESGTTDAEKAALTKAESGLFAARDAVKAKLAEAVKGDVAAAIPVCGDAAKAAVDAQAAAGVKVGRVGTRLRNPSNTPPDWVATWLATVPANAKGNTVEPYAHIDTTPTGPVARVIRPISLDATCLVCHGPAGDLSPEVQKALAAKYPDDKATGYVLGDLRGAWWAETPVSATP